MTLRNHRLVNTCHLLFFFYSNLAYPTDHRVQICILHTRYFPPYTSGAGTHSSNYLSRRLGIYLSNCLRGLLTNVSIVQNSPISTEWYFLTYSRCNFDTASLLVHRPLPLNDASNVNLVMIVVLIDLCDSVLRLIYGLRYDKRIKLSVDGRDDMASRRTLIVCPPSRPSNPYIDESFCEP